MPDFMPPTPAARSTYGLGPDGHPTAMAQSPSLEYFNSMNAFDLRGLSAEQAVERLWTDWQVRWALVRAVDRPFPGYPNNTQEGTGLVLSHRSEPWWAVVSVWTGGLPDGLIAPWQQRDVLARHWSLGKTIGAGLVTPSAEWASCLTDLIICTRARMRHERTYPHADRFTFPLDEVLDCTPVTAVPDITAAHTLAALRS